MLLFWSLACSVERPEPPVKAPPTLMKAAAGAYRRGPAAVVAHGTPCRVERVPILTEERQELFRVEGSCPVHCAFEDRMAVCVEGDRVVRHLYGGGALVLHQAPWLAGVERLFLAPDGVPHVLARDGEEWVERVVTVAGATEVQRSNERPAVEVSALAYDLDSRQRDCPSGQCRAMGQVPASAIERYEAAHPGLRATGTVLFPTEALLAGTRDGHPAGPVWRCRDLLCTEHDVLSEQPRSYVLNPPFVLLRDPQTGEAEVVGLEGAPSRQLGPTAWATFVPLDVQI